MVSEWWWWSSGIQKIKSFLCNDLLFFISDSNNIGCVMCVISVTANYKGLTLSSRFTNLFFLLQIRLVPGLHLVSSVACDYQRAKWCATSVSMCSLERAVAHKHTLWLSEGTVAINDSLQWQFTLDWKNPLDMVLSRVSLSNKKSSKKFKARLTHEA